MNKKKVLAALCALSCTLTLTACGNKADKILGYVDKMDFSGALDYYDEKVDGSSKERDIRKEVKSEMDDKYELILEKYNEGELKEKDLEDLYEFVDELKLDNKDYEEFAEKLAELEVSKEYYEKGIEYFEKEDYSDAVYYLGYVVKEDKNYKDAQAKIAEAEEAQIEEDLGEVDEYLSENEYESAINLLNSYKYEYEENEKFQELYQKVNDEVVKYSEAEIQKYFESGEYTEASRFIRNYADYYFSDNEEMVALKTNLADSYADFVIKKAEEQFGSKNYAESAVTIQEAIEVLGEDNEKLNTANEKYSAYLPVYINDMDYNNIEGSLYVNYFGSTHDYFDNEYKTYYYIDSYSAKECWAEYDINGAYNKLMGTVSVVDTYSTLDGTKYFEVYGDDKLLYTSPEMTTSSKPTEMDIDVTGVNKIKIVYPATEGSNALAGMFDARLVKTGETPSQPATEAETTESAETTETADATEAADTTETAEATEAE